MGLILSKELFIWNTAIISIAVLSFPQVSVFSEKLWKKERRKVIWLNLCSERRFIISMRLSSMKMVNQSKLSILKNNKFTHTTSSSKAISSRKYYKKRSDTTIERQAKDQLK